MRSIPGLRPADVPGLQSRYHRLGPGASRQAPHFDPAQGGKGGRRVEQSRPVRSSCLTCKYVQVKVQALDFSPDGRFILSLGGQDDGSLVSSRCNLHKLILARCRSKLPFPGQDSSYQCILGALHDKTTHSMYSLSFNVSPHAMSKCTVHFVYCLRCNWWYMSES